MRDHDDHNVTLRADRAELEAALRREFAAQEPFLAIIKGSAAGALHKVGGSLVIGRGTDVDLRLDDEGVSRRHLRLTRDEDGQIVIEDLGSANGTFVNGERIARQVLRNGDRVRVGTATFLKLTYQCPFEESLQRQLHEAATRDPTTGISNRRVLEEALEREVAFARRHQRPLSFLLLDMDHFKRVNDVFGHLAGDHVLRMVAAIVSGTTRTEDLVARFGGEELAVVLRDIAAEGAARCAERLRQAVEAARIEHEGRVIALTASIGVVTCLPGAALSRETLLAAADRNLYAAKDAGRNRCVASVVAATAPGG